MKEKLRSSVKIGAHTIYTTSACIMKFWWAITCWEKKSHHTWMHSVTFNMPYFHVSMVGNTKKIDMKILLRHIKCIVNTCITMDECSNVIYRGTGNVNIFPSNINDKIRENLPI